MGAVPDLTDRREASAAEALLGRTLAAELHREGDKVWEQANREASDAHGTAPHLKKALAEVAEHCVWVRELGSYPRATRTVG